MDSDFLKRWIVDAWRRTVMHHGFWFREVEDRFGMPAACVLDAQVFERSAAIQRARYQDVLLPAGDGDSWPQLDALDLESLNALMDATAKNWLVNDGVWFQAVEAHASMDEAKLCNDGAWSRFAPYEASCIRALVELDQQAGGLEALKIALRYRLYARINQQAILEEQEGSFLFRMLECRVQLARQRKGLPNYPCKSAGIIEFTSFAKAIHPAIQTSCIACPPDPAPRDWFCGWRFSMDPAPAL